MNKRFVIVDTPRMYRIDMNIVMKSAKDYSEAFKSFKVCGARRIDFQFDIDLTDKDTFEMVVAAQDVFPFGMVKANKEVIPLVHGSVDQELFLEPLVANL